MLLHSLSCVERRSLVLSSLILTGCLTGVCAAGIGVADEFPKPFNTDPADSNPPAPEEMVRIFVDEGDPLADLLRQLIAAHGSMSQRTYARKLLVIFDAVKTPAPPLLDPLSERELEILRLTATGLSNKKLAETLILTVGTVKWHLNNIYSKLGVSSRTEAVARARELGLL